MIIDLHTHLFASGWVPPAFFHGVARFITHEFARQGIHEFPETVGDSLLESTSDPEGVMLLDEMDEAGIDRSVVFPIDFGLAAGEPPVSIHEVNRRIARVANKHPDRFTAFAGVDPRRHDSLDLFTRCIEQWGMKGLKLHPSAGFYPHQEEVYPLLDKACAARLPVIIHAGAMMLPWRSRFSQAICFDDLAVDFPDLAIIAAHAGGALGYTSLLSIMGVKLNIMVDISAWQIAALKNNRYFCSALRTLIDFSDPERVFFGSDSPSFRSVLSNKDWVDLIRSLPRNSPDGISFSEREITALLGGNAQRLLGL